MEKQKPTVVIEKTRPAEQLKESYFNIPCYAYGTTGETKLDQKTPTSDGKDNPESDIYQLGSKSSSTKNQEQYLEKD